jgi:hypothetical protein
MIERPVHKTRVWKSSGMWYAECKTCPKGLQDIVMHWFGHITWKDALETALRHNHPNRWSRT